MPLAKKSLLITFVYQIKKKKYLLLLKKLLIVKSEKYSQALALDCF
jgi:two-component SAPR family response regulator